MTINRLRIGHFGKIKDLQINLKKGFNIIYGENESGKSTIQAFVKTMLYGMNSQKKDIKENPRLHYIPWGEKKAYGELYFQDSHNNEYIIKRSFGNKKREDESEVLNLVTGDIAPHIPVHKPGEELFGLGEEAFEKTAWIKQLGSGVFQGKDDELLSRLTNLQETGEENVSYNKAMEELNESRKLLTNQRSTGKLDKLKEHYSNLLYELRESNKRYQESIDDEIELKLMIEQKNKLIEDNNRLEKERQDRLYYDKWIKLKAELDNIKSEAKAIEKKLEKLEGLKIQYMDYENLDQNKVHKLVESIGEKKYLEEKLQEYNALLKEWEESQKELEEFLDTLGEITKFEQVNSTMEIDINRLETSYKELQFKLEQSSKQDSLTIRKDIFIDKNKTLSVFLVFGAVLFIGGALGGFFLNNRLYFLIAIGVMLFTWAGNSKKNILLKISNLDKEINELKNPRVIKDLEDIKSTLREIYSSLGVSNYEEYIEGLGKYRKNQSKLEGLKINNEQKSLALDKFNINKIKAKLLGTNNYIEQTFDLYKCLSVEELNSKLEEYKGFLNEKSSLNKELSKVYKELDFNSKTLEELEIEISSKVDLFKIKEPPKEEEINKQAKEFHEKEINLEKNIKDKEYSIEMRFLNHRQPTQVQEEISSVKEKIFNYEKSIKAIDMAGLVLKEAFQEMQRSFGPRLNRMSADVLGKITGDKYNELKISEDYEIKVIDPVADSIKKVDYFSNGTWDQIYFSLRMGLIDLLFQDDKNISILLDDAFLQYDDNRLERTLKYLYKVSQERQIILFTCQRREIDIMKEFENINYIEI